MKVFISIQVWVFFHLGIFQPIGFNQTFYINEPIGINQSSGINQDLVLLKQYKQILQWDLVNLPLNQFIFIIIDVNKNWFKRTKVSEYYGGW